MKEPVKEITAEEFLKSKQIPIPTYEAVRLMDSEMKDYRIVDLLKDFASLKEREVIKAAIEKTGKALLEMEIDWYDHMSKSQDPDYCHGRVNAYIDAQVIVKQVLNSMLNPATNGEDKGE